MIFTPQGLNSFKIIHYQFQICISTGPCTQLPIDEAVISDEKRGFVSIYCDLKKMPSEKFE